MTRHAPRLAVIALSLTCLLPAAAIRNDERIVLVPQSCPAEAAMAPAIFSALTEAGLSYELTSDRLTVSGQGHSRAFSLPGKASRGKLLGATSQGVIYYVNIGNKSVFTLRTPAFARVYFAIDQPVSDAALDRYGATIAAFPHVVLIIGRDARAKPVLQLDDETITAILPLQADNSILIVTEKRVWKLLPSRHLYPVLSGPGRLRSAGDDIFYCEAQQGYRVANLSMLGEPVSDRQYSAYLVSRGAGLLNQDKPAEALRFLLRAKPILPDDRDLADMIDLATKRIPVR